MLLASCSPWDVKKHYVLHWIGKINRHLFIPYTHSLGRGDSTCRIEPHGQGLHLGTQWTTRGVGVWLYSDKRVGDPPISSGGCDWLARIIPQVGISVKHATQRWGGTASEVFDKAGCLTLSVGAQWEGKLVVKPFEALPISQGVR